MTRPPKPDFQRVGAWVAFEPWPAALKRDLDDILRGAMPGARRVEFLRLVGQEVELLNEIKPDIAPAAELGKNFDSLIAASDGLLQALQKLPEGAMSSLSAHFDYLACGTDPSARLSHLGRTLTGPEGAFLETLWHLASDLGLCAADLKERLPAGNRQTQPTRLIARQFIQRIASAYLDLSGELPPYSKETWFVLFIDCLCRSPVVRLPGGQALVETVIKEMHNPNR
jgi:hypothetical protein